jgi:hypothetical protein
MEKNIIIENAKSILNDILNEEVSKVSRQDFNRVLFKLEELETSLNETIKEYKKLEDSIPNGLKNTTNRKMLSLQSHLVMMKKEILVLTNNVRIYKKRTNQQIDEKKK